MQQYAITHSCNNMIGLHENITDKLAQSREHPNFISGAYSRKRKGPGAQLHPRRQGYTSNDIIMPALSSAAVTVGGISYIMG